MSPTERIPELTSGCTGQTYTLQRRAFVSTPVRLVTLKLTALIATAARKWEAPRRALILQDINRAAVRSAAEILDLVRCVMVKMS